MNGSALEVDGHRITVTHLDRVLYPQTGTRKYDVISYYLAVADALLPHLASRPVTRKRWPSGVDGAPFFEKALPPGAPPWLTRYTIGHAGGDKIYPVVRDAATLVWFAQMSALELHVPQWRIDLSDQLPEEAERRTRRLVLDLDPGPGVPLQQCAQVALTIRDVLTAAGMSSYPVTSGGSGIHVYAVLPDPVRANSARTVARQLAVSLAQAYPDDVTAKMHKAARPGKVFVDWSQNSATKTTLTPYSLRGRERPWVAAPRTWSELTESDLSQLEYHQVLDRLADAGDLLSGLDPDPAVPPAEGVVDLGAYRRRRTTTGRAASDHAASDHAATHNAAIDDATDHHPAAAALPPTAPAPTVGSGATGRATRMRMRPMLAVNQPVEGLDQTRWAFEGKWDGYRILAQVTGGRLRLQSRSGIDMTADFPELATLGSRLDGHEGVLDGEVVAVNAAGQTDFRLLASRRHEPGEATIRLFLFDVLEWDGTNLELSPWEQRRAVLESLAPLFASIPAVQIPALLDPPGEAAVEQARRNGWEGVVAKRRSSPYRQGARSPDWRKQKNFNDLEVVIGGFRFSRAGAGKSLGSVLVGLPQENGLRYLGRVGTGWTQAQAGELLDELRPLAIRTCPFVGGVDAPAASSATWVLPTLVADVQFLDWTSTGHLRHPSWRGIRRDKLPGDL